MRHAVRIGFLALTTSAAASAEAATLKVPKQFATIPDAIAAATIGDTIVVAKGTYPGLISVSEKTQLTIKGKGAVIDAGGNSHGMVVDDSIGIVIQGFTIRNVNSANVTISGGARDVELRDCTLQDSGGEGVFIAISRDVRIRDCRIEDVAGNAIGIISNFVLAEGNRIRRCGDGIALDGSSSAFLDNRIEDVNPLGFGMLLDGGTGTIVAADNVLRDIPTVGISIPNGANGFIGGNAISDVGDGGIELDSQNECVVDGNKIQRANEVGIAILNTGTGNLLRGNRVVRCAGSGIFVAPMCDTNHLHENSTLKNAAYGVFVDSELNVLVKNRGSKNGIFDLRYDDIDNTFIGNDFATIAPLF